MSFDWLTGIPTATIFILLLSLTISFITSLGNRLLTDRNQLRAWNKEIAAWRADSVKATRTGDKKLAAKVKKQQKHIMQLQSKVMFQSMKTSFLWFIPLMLIWYLFLIPVFGPSTVAYLPGLPGLFGTEPEWKLSYFWWYLLCSFLFGALFSRLFGLTLGGD